MIDIPLDSLDSPWRSLGRGSSQCTSPRNRATRPSSRSCTHLRMSNGTSQRKGRRNPHRQRNASRRTPDSWSCSPRSSWHWRRSLTRLYTWRGTNRPRTRQGTLHWPAQRTAQNRSRSPGRGRRPYLRLLACDVTRRWGDYLAARVGEMYWSPQAAGLARTFSESATRMVTQASSGIASCVFGAGGFSGAARNAMTDAMGGVQPRCNGVAGHRETRRTSCVRVVQPGEARAARSVRLGEARRHAEVARRASPAIAPCREPTALHQLSPRPFSPADAAGGAALAGGEPTNGRERLPPAARSLARKLRSAPIVSLSRRTSGSVQGKSGGRGSDVFRRSTTELSGRGRPDGQPCSSACASTATTRRARRRRSGSRVKGCTRSWLGIG